MFHHRTSAGSQFNRRENSSSLDSQKQLKPRRATPCTVDIPWHLDLSETENLCAAVSLLLQPERELAS
ncbi:MAG: hypothetical protein DWI22_02975 [Planctomycetota bacterium]|nr:MAG: hypothetical protein DWI22_02975 [Planctomycetota bacterium]